ncbi:molybdopterin-guanine dinucleotide biosynthesis adapter protein MobB [Clostridium aceticum]|uniref:Molybdopterin-guanine dinucleotide biosynthesis adapter protein MobB n=1 Tax=Clostridium aceticum TaxID=84022 RepID=A0A0D8IDM0_9CLOT|nr:molybdopterin-guanine dinucleotide biosynthesis protein B [Clostridium aceticum]AKL94374.1 molybdopterin-guanine dinucleotide biosynthesis adapter protein MobB [Clostridium aceticum]KJF28395.1 molybdopterin-guanine dinucleotide biosynthesis protein [Clostridium aceticum]
MKVFSVRGITQSGKTTTIENIIKELKKRRYSVGSVKDIHFEEFAIDQEGTNTYRHRRAGSELVTARGHYETDILFPEKLNVEEILRFYNQDFVVLEGVEDTNAPKIITAHDVKEVEERIDGTVFAISGRIANTLQEYKGVPVINAMSDVEKLVDLIEEKVYEKLPEFSGECCCACGYSCRELGIKILKGEAKREDCILGEENIKLSINQQEISMVPFVQKILYNAVMGVVAELEGYHKGSNIQIKVGER